MFANVPKLSSLIQTAAETLLVWSSYAKSIPAQGWKENTESEFGSQTVFGCTAKCSTLNVPNLAY
jgi:hypothetical protein